MQLTMLGTGHAMVTRCYNTCFVIEEEGKYFMVDGGGGNAVFGQLQSAGIPPFEIRDIFVTHKHVDHLLGVVWMMRLLARPPRPGEEKTRQEVRVYGHDEVIGLLREMVENLVLPAGVSIADTGVRMITVKDGERVEILGHPVTFFDIGSVKAKQFGFVMEIADGERLTCCGDEPCHPRIHDYARGSKWMLHEAFCLEAEEKRYHPHDKQHSTVKDACELAQSLGVQNLLLYHTEDEYLEERKRLYTEEGKKYYDGRLYVPDDLEKFTL